MTEMSPEAVVPDAAEDTHDEHNSTCPCGHDHTDVDPQSVAALKDIAEKVNALDPERRSLLLTGVLGKVEGVLEALLEALVENPEATPNAASLVRPLSLAAASLGFAGMIAQTTHDAEEDWTRTGDKQVNALWSEFAEIVAKAQENPTRGAVVITPDDVDIEVLKRVAAGNGTDEDRALLKRVVAEKSGVDPDDINVEAMLVGEQGEVRPVPGAAAAESEEEHTVVQGGPDYSGRGLYL